ncbi:MAG: NifB/NifX family molybdenum-iron cluster-binding protein [Clostridium sp.]|nr:NifB/NifX family molybdenum-iron cluster-binding protein [Clostridium sp.]
MFIAVTSMTEELDGIVPKTFKESPFLMIIDADQNNVIKIYGKQDEENMVFAQKVLDHDCEAIICGLIEKEPFELMAGHMVSRYDGSGHTVARAYQYMVQYRLDLIRDYIGGPGAVGHSHDFSCECGEEEEEE